MLNKQYSLDVMNMAMTKLPKITDITERFSQFTFDTHEVFHWSPKNNTVYYDQDELNSKYGIFQLLHEIGHALCGHKNYTSGIELLKIETDAWQKAKELAAEYGLVIREEQIERCLDSYRDWLHMRSECPRCEAISIEFKKNYYHCFNCMQKWKVPSDQRTRQYRMKTEVFN